VSFLSFLVVFDSPFAPASYCRAMLKKQRELTMYLIAIQQSTKRKFLRTPKLRIQVEGEIRKNRRH
jgi:hypothetical protein